MSIVSAAILCTVVGRCRRIILVAAAKFMAVEEDPVSRKSTPAWPAQTAAAAAMPAVRITQRLWSWTASPAISAHPAARLLRQPLPRSWAATLPLWSKAVVQCQGNSEHCKAQL